MTIQTKTAIEFGESVTLYRAIDDETGWGTLWHRSKEKALCHLDRHRNGGGGVIKEVTPAPTIRIHYSRWYWFKWGIAKHFHPEAVTEAWYAQECPPQLDTSVLTRRQRLCWVIDKWLRECNKTA